MWISKKKWNGLEKRVADLEREVQSQQTEVIYEKLVKQINMAIDSVFHIPQEQ